MSSSFVFPQLAPFYAALAPWVEALLRVVVALCLVPHGLRMSFGFFPNTGMGINSVRKLGVVLDNAGYRPGQLWAPIIAITELVCGPMLALGFLTRIVAIPIVILLLMSIVDHRKFGWFWNMHGVEYPVIWSCAALYFLVHGGGPISLDALIGWQF
jgi:putative oxidoreductase